VLSRSKGESDDLEVVAPGARDAALEGKFVSEIMEWKAKNPAVQHRGKAAAVCRRMLVRSGALGLLLALLLGGLTELVFGKGWIAGIVVAALWFGFALFCLGFFRDPEPVSDATPDCWVAPAHGLVDVIDEVTEPEFMGGACRRISIFLSVFDVHVQHSPASGRVVFLRHRTGEFLNALRLESAARNENVLIGIESGTDPMVRVGVRLIAGLIARRIVPWVRPEDRLDRGERISLIQFGSRVDLYLPLTARVEVRERQRVRGGVTVVGRRC